MAIKFQLSQLWSKIKGLKNKFDFFSRVDEDELIDVLCNRNNAQRQEIVANYVTLYGEELYDRVNKKV